MVLSWIKLEETIIIKPSYFQLFNDSNDSKRKDFKQLALQVFLSEFACLPFCFFIYVIELYNLAIKKNSSMSQLAQTSILQTAPGECWKGAHSAKFTGGRFHLNHPQDQLDHFVSNDHAAQLNNSGKKTFPQKHSDGQNTQTRPHLRTFENKYKKSTFFEEETITKLIKVPFQSDKQFSTNVQIQNKYNYATIGTSKIKAMQSGVKKFGIYRHFYNSQLKSTNAIRFHDQQ